MNTHEQTPADSERESWIAANELRLKAEMQGQESGGAINRGMAFALILFRDGLPLNQHELGFVAERFNATIPNPSAGITALHEFVSGLVRFYESKPYRSSWEDEQLEQARAALAKTP